MFSPGLYQLSYYITNYMEIIVALAYCSVYLFEFSGVLWLLLANGHIFCYLVLVSVTVEI